MPEQQIKSKERVSEHGEVFTAEREVNAMLDLVKPETERIDSRFLEPACGEGAFLTEILRRKLAAVKNRYGKNAADYERYSVLAVTSIYGVDIQADNAAICRANLYEIWNEEYSAAVKYILSKNIVCGDALTLLDKNGEPIEFAEWSFVTPTLIKRRDYRFDELLNGHEQEINLFVEGWEYDAETKAFIPAPIREYPLCDYRKVADGNE